MAQPPVSAPGIPDDLSDLLFESNPSPMWVFDEESLGFLAVNEAAVQLYGYSRSEFLSMTLKDIRPQEDIPKLLEAVRGRPRRPYDGTWHHTKKDGSLIEIEFVANRIVWLGSPARLVIVRDITQRAQAERALRESEKRFELVSRAASEVVYDWDMTAGTVWWSDGLLRVLGYDSESSVTDQSWWEKRIHPEDLPSVAAALRQADEPGRQLSIVDYRFLRADGTYAHIHDRAYILRGENGKAARMIGAMRDITERKRAEEALRQSEERMHQMAEAIQDVFYLSDAETNEMIYVNPAFDRIWGISRRHIQNQPRAWLDAVHPDDRERVVRALSLWKPEGERPEWNEEFRIVRPDGSVRWVWVRSFPIRDESGTIVRFAGVERDITERKRTEETIRSLLSITRELSSTLDAGALMVSLVRETLKLVDAKGGFAGMQTPQGMVCEKYCTGSQVVDFVHCWALGAGLPGWVVAHKSTYLTNDAGMDPLFSPELKERFGVQSAICAPLTDTRGEVLGFIEIHDKNDGTEFDRFDEEKVTAVAHAASVAVQNALAYRKLEETTEALRIAGLKYRGIFENALEGIAQTSKEGKFLTANPALARMLGFDSPEELIGNVQSVGRDLYVDPDVRSVMMRTLGNAGEVTGLETQVYRKDRTPIWVLMNVRAVRDGTGAILHYDSIVQDITLRKSTEENLRDVSGRLLRSQNEERRRIARELHDSTAQNLAALAMNLGLIRKAGAPPDRTSARRLKESQALAQQACREIRTLSYLLHPPELEDGDLWSAVRWYTEGFSNRSGIRVDLSLPKASRAGRLPEQVETTLFRIVQESLANIHRHSGSRRARIRFARGRSGLTMTVRDQGRGIRPARDGAPSGPALMGVGIAGMRERVQQLGGRLEIDSSARGTAVKVTLPLPRGN
ncbi:MAG: PAS domain S-box protein [Acidobacteria bacterium]|nr:PAS domain S-box protein [Acidobacteriota bacterium]